MINSRVDNNNLLVSNLGLLSSKKSTRLIADVATGTGSISVAGISGFAVDNYILIGNFGEASAEIIKLHAATAPTGTTITLATNTTKDHYTDSPVTLLGYNQVEFSRATTLAGSKVVLATQSINADEEESYYQDLTNTTGYAFMRFKNSTTSTFSAYTTGVSYSGHGNTTVRDIVEKACADTLVDVGGEFSTEKMLLNDANDAQDAITDFDWKFEIVKNDTSLTATQYENTYALSGLTHELKYPGIVQGIKSVKFSGTRLDYIDNDEMDNVYRDVVRTTVATQAEIADTSLVLTNTSELPDSGTVYVNGLAIDYTTNTTTTNTLSGISAADITAILAVGSSVWYNINSGLPTKYTITIDNNIILNVPVDADYNGYSFTMEYLKKLTRFTDFASTTEIPFVDSMPDYIKAKIEQRKRNFENYDKFMAIFDKAIQAKLDFYKLPVFEDSRYYNFFDSGHSSLYNNND